MELTLQVLCCEQDRAEVVLLNELPNLRRDSSALEAHLDAPKKISRYSIVIATQCSVTYHEQLPQCPAITGEPRILNTQCDMHSLVRIVPYGIELVIAATASHLCRR